MSELAEQSRYRHIRRAVLVVLALDLVMAVGKGLYGYFSGSLGMVSDGLHSTLHASGGVIGLVGVTLAARAPDPDHPYGYERYEPLASMGIAAFMLLAFWRILASAWGQLQTVEVPRVDAGSFAVMGGALLLTLAVASWERRRARELESTVLGADAARVWADVLVSASVLAGLVAARLGFPRVDTIVSLLVAGAIGWSAWGIVRGASRVLTDAAVGDIEKIAAAARSVDGVIDTHQVRARGAGGRVRVDLHITVDPQLTVAQGHTIGDEVERRVRERIGGIAEVLVHVGAATLHGTPAQAPTLADIRAELLQQHASLRSLAARVQDVATRTPSARASEVLTRMLRALAGAVDAHNNREEALLGDVVPTIDSWGDVRAARMDEHHRQEHRRLEEALRAAAATADFSAAIRLALPVIDDLLEHLHAEESDLVNPNVLRDDIVVIDQSDG